MTTRTRVLSAGTILAAAALCAPIAVASPAAAASGSDDLKSPQISTPNDFDGPQLRTPSAKAPAQQDADKQSGTAANAKSAPAIPGVGPKNMAKLPAGTKQVLVASTKSQKGTNARTTLYELHGTTWKKVASFAGHNGANGWEVDRREGDKTTPSGVFSLTAAGGYDKNPGTKLPYTQDRSMKSGARAAYGQDAGGVFDYVIAIDFNRKPGTPPRDGNRPLGPKPGGGIWLHVDHDSGTHGCVTLQKKDIEYLLKSLKPAAKPHIIMGSAADIGK